MLTRWVLKTWPAILIFSLLIGAASVPRMIQLYRHISTDPIDLLPQDHPNVQTLIQVRQKVENRTRVTLVLESEKPEATIRYMKELVGRLEKEPFIEKVQYLKPGYAFFDKYKLLFLDLKDLTLIRDRIDRRIQQEKLKGFLFDLDGEEGFDFKDLEEKYRVEYSDASRSEYYASQDGKTFSLYLESKETGSSLKTASIFYDQIETLFHKENPSAVDPTLNLYLAGPSKVLEYRALLRDLKVAGLISGLCLFLPLLIRFRNPIVVLLIFAPLFIGIPISFAIGSLFISRLSVTTSFLFAVLGGLGIESGIHIYSRYDEARREGLPLEIRLKEIYEKLAPGMLTSVLSLAVTFLLLVVNDFRGFSEFGLISGIGLGVIFLLYFTFFPALLIFLEKIHLLRGPQDRRAGDSPTGGPPPAQPHCRGGTSPLVGGDVPKGQRGRQAARQDPLHRLVKIALLFFGLLSLYSFAAPFRINFEYDSKKIRADIPEVRIAKEKQRSTISRVNNPAVLLVQNREEADSVKQLLRERKESAPDSTIDTARSYFDLVPPDMAEKMKIIEEMKKKLSDPTLKLVKGEQKKALNHFREILQTTTPFTEKEVPEEVLEVFTGKKEPPGALLFINAKPRLELDDGRNAIKFADEIREVETEFGKKYPSSDASIFGIVLKTMFQDIPRVLILSLLSVFVFVYLDFRSLPRSLLVLTSILMGVLWLLGLMQLFGIKFNFYNMIIIPSVMGMSIDNGIHLMHRYKELGKGSLKKVISTTGIAALLSSLTNAGGFIGLLFSIHRGLYSIGLLAVLGVGTCLLSTLVFLPLLLKLREKPPIEIGGS